MKKHLMLYLLGLIAGFFLKAVRHGQELMVSAFNVQTICESKTSLQETARRCGYPITLIKAVREYFGFNPLTDTSVDAVE